jgi:hypothetical protein
MDLNFCGDNFGYFWNFVLPHQHSALVRRRLHKIVPMEIVVDFSAIQRIVSSGSAIGRNHHLCLLFLLV